MCIRDRYVGFGTVRWFAKVDSVVECSAFVSNVSLFEATTCLAYVEFLTSVSYTHLDVYKRQTELFMCIHMANTFPC